MINLLAQQISSLVEIHLKFILSDISAKYNISENELKEKYLQNQASFLTQQLQQPQVSSKPSSIPSPQLKPISRSRRKSPTQKLSTPVLANVEENIETEVFEYNDVKYLLDADNNLYTYDLEEPAHIGHVVNGKVKLFIDD